MCGILGILGKKNIDLNKVKSLSNRMVHRGPDEHDYHLNEVGNVITHERLSIIDLKTGKQPIKGSENAYVVHNGEIYNYKELQNNELSEIKFTTTCDSEVIVHLYEKYGISNGSVICNKLSGIFSFIIIDGEDYLIGRDPIGIKPLYWGHDNEGALYISSELKAIEDQVIELEAFPPGYFFSSKEGLVKYYNPTWLDYKNCNTEFNKELLKNTLIGVIKNQLVSDVPIGVLLSGGLDSSLISSITSKLVDKTQKLHSFSIGLDSNSPDLKYARLVAEHIGTEHHEVYFSIEEGLQNLEKLIWHLETYDITSIRASTPMFFLSKYIKNMGIKVVLSGEGADEIFGGYLYFHNAPDNTEFQKETIRRVGLLSTADCLRADKSTMANGLEVRVPFLDKDFLEVSMLIDPIYKIPNKVEGIIEKKILRDSFDDKENPWLPDSILWRQKEQFSDGVGYSWIDELIKYCESQISDEEMEKASSLFPINTPSTKEAMFMRKIFHKHFPSENAAKTVLKWVPKWQKNEDPSGRASEIHDKSVEL